MIVLASNMSLDAFDDAVKDRIDEFVEFEMPDSSQRHQLINMFLNQYGSILFFYFHFIP
jgi:AAA+ superfamily predicted ATPase